MEGLFSEYGVQALIGALTIGLARQYLLQFINEIRVLRDDIKAFEQRLQKFEIDLQKKATKEQIDILKAQISKLATHQAVQEEEIKELRASLRELKIRH